MAYRQDRTHLLASTNGIARATPPETEDKLAHIHVHARYLEDITTPRIGQFITKRMREEGIAAKTANRFRETLHRLFEYAIKNWGFVSQDRRFPNPAANVERRREPARTIRFLQMDQIEEQLRILEDRPNLYVIVATLIYAGLRREECLWLTTKDVDFRRRLIHVRAKTIDEVFWQPKTKRNRVARNTACHGLPPCAVTILRDGVPENQRVICFRLAVHMYRLGFPEELTLPMLIAWSKRNRPVNGKRIITNEEIIQQTHCAYKAEYRGYGCNDPMIARYCTESCPLKRATSPDPG